VYGNDPRDLTAALRQMAQTSVDTSWGNKIEAKEKMRTWLEQDRRFDPFDKSALVDRVMLCRYNGAVLDLEDPELKGLPPRPLQRSKW
jgi:hypothetical protein